MSVLVETPDGESWEHADAVTFNVLNQGALFVFATNSTRPPSQQPIVAAYAPGAWRYAEVST